MYLRTLMIFLFAAVVLVTETGCSSYFKRKDCEATNWHAYGQKVALSGRRLSGDGFISDCRLVEAEIKEAELDNGFKQGMAKYCEPAQAFATGKSGKPFSSEMCDGENLSVLNAKHVAGVAEYCQRSNGFVVGAKGKPYNRICPQALEGPFLTEFNRGRRSYLIVLLNENEHRISNIDQEISQLEAQARSKQWEAQQLLVPQMVVETVYDPTSHTHREDRVWKVTDQNRSAADSLHWRVRGIDSEISDKRSEQSKLRDRNRNIRLESVALEAKGEG